MFSCKNPENPWQLGALPPDPRLCPYLLNPGCATGQACEVFWLATPLSKNHPFKSIIDFFLAVNRFRYNKVGILANHPFYHFWQTIVSVIFAGGPVLILVPGPGLALNGPDRGGSSREDISKPAAPPRKSQQKFINFNYFFQHYHSMFMCY